MSATEETLAERRERHAACLEEHRETLELIANSGTQFAPRARNALAWLDEYQVEHDEGKDSEGVSPHA